MGTSSHHWLIYGWKFEGDADNYLKKMDDLNDYSFSEKDENIFNNIVFVNCENFSVFGTVIAAGSDENGFDFPDLENIPKWNCVYYNNFFNRYFNIKFMDFIASYKLIYTTGKLQMFTEWK